MDFVLSFNQFSCNVSSVVSIVLGVGTLACIAWLGYCWRKEISR